MGGATVHHHHSLRRIEGPIPPSRVPPTAAPRTPAITPTNLDHRTTDTARRRPHGRSTAQGKVEGIDDSTRSGTWCWKGLPLPSRRSARCAGAWSPGRARGKPESACDRPSSSATPACRTAASTARRQQHLRRHDRHHPEHPGRQRGLPDAQHLASGQHRREAAGAALHPRRSNISGYTADPVYDGANLAKKANAVIVTANYRLGVLGFLNLPQLHVGGTEGDDSGNFALLDNLAALRYIQKNIAGFGGDAANVTVMGQSAGAINLLALMASPMAKGLFHKAMPLSGGISLATNLPPGSLPTLNPASTYLAQGNGLLLNLLVADGKAADLAGCSDLRRRNRAGRRRRLPARQGRQDHPRHRAGQGPDRLGPDPGRHGAADRPDRGDGRRPVPEGADRGGRHARRGQAPHALPAAGRRPQARPQDRRCDRFTMMQNFNPDAATTLNSADIIDPAYLPVTTPVTGYDAMTARITNAFMVPSRNNLLNTLKTQQSNLWHYQFDWAQRRRPGTRSMARRMPSTWASCSVISGRRCSPTRASAPPTGPAGRRCPTRMMGSIAAFMRTGDPNSAALGTTWAPWPSRLLLDATPAAASISTQ